MTDVIASLTHAPGAPAISTRGLLSVPGLVGIGLFLSVILTLPSIKLFLTTGFFLDPDDAMRMSQARDFLNGQGWFDLHAWRLDPPNGVFMHWTRIVDVPIALVVKFFELFTDQETAERWMRLVFPLTLLAGLFALSARIAHRLLGDAGPVHAVLLTVFGGAMYGYFAPGRLDHDHVAILGLVVMTGTLMRALDPRELWAAAVTGLIIAFNLSVSLETLPFLIIGVAVLPAAWILHGAPMRGTLLAFAGGLLPGLILAFAITVAPDRYLNGACDTLSAAHMVAGLTGGVLCLALGLLTSALASLPARLATAVVAGGLTVAAVALSYPDCLGDPYAHVDPVLRELWLDGVSEARPLAKAIKFHPSLILLLVVPILIGLGGSLWAAISETGLMRARWIALTALVLAGCAASVWQVRATGVVSPLSLFGSAYVVMRLTRTLFAKASPLAVPAVALGCFCISPLFLGLFTPDESSPAEGARAVSEVACRVQSAFEPIAALPLGIILSPIDTGAHLLARTPHGVTAAAFHRNEHGNRLALDAFRASPAEAEAIVRRAGASYVAFCPAINDIELYRDIAPQGLGAQLDDGIVPPWLELLKLDTPYKVFRVR